MTQILAKKIKDAVEIKKVDLAPLQPNLKSAMRKEWIKFGILVLILLVVIAYIIWLNIKYKYIVI